MKKIMIAAAAFAMAAAFTACGDDSSSAGLSCEVKVTDNAVLVVENIPGLGEFTTSYDKNAEGTYGVMGFGSYSLEEAKAMAQEDCDAFYASSEE